MFILKFSDIPLKPLQVDVLHWGNFGMPTAGGTNGGSSRPLLSTLTMRKKPDEYSAYFLNGIWGRHFTQCQIQLFAGSAGRREVVRSWTVGNLSVHSFKIDDKAPFLEEVGLTYSHVRIASAGSRHGPRITGISPHKHSQMKGQPSWAIPYRSVNASNSSGPADSMPYNCWFKHVFRRIYPRTPKTYRDPN